MGVVLSPNGSLKNDMATIIVVVFPLWPLFCRVIISKSTYYYFIINTTGCKTFSEDIKERAPWTFEWGGGNCARGLQGHSRLDSAKATLNCFRPQAHESRLECPCKPRSQFLPPHSEVHGAHSVISAKQVLHAVVLIMKW